MQIDKDVLIVLSSGESDGNVFKITSGQLTRDLYLKVNKVLETLGGKWNRKVKGHVFETDVADLIDNVIITGEIGKKNPLEFFETPPELARQMVELAKIEPGMRVLEPSAGKGAIANVITEMHSDINLWVCEINPVHRQYLLSQGYHIAETDFLKMPCPPRSCVDNPDAIVQGDEEWRPVVGYEHEYEVSSWGRLRRLSTVKGFRAGTFVAGGQRKDGYINVVLCSNGHTESRLMHQIVADAFIGPRPDGMQLNHLHPDGDKARNWVSNLEYVSSVSNNEDQRANRPADYTRGEMHPLVKLRDTDVSRIKERLASGESHKLIANDYGVQSSCIWAIAAGRSWKYAGGPPLSFDRIVLNPPFSQGQDVVHVNHSYELLMPGGRVVAIMSAGITFREDKKYVQLRDLITKNGMWVRNPEGTFKVSGTMVNTVTVVIDKPVLN